MKMKRSIVSLLLAFVLMFTIQAPAEVYASDYYGFNPVVTCKDTTVELSWSTPNYSYIKSINYYRIKDVSTGQYSNPLYSNGCIFNDLGKGFTGKVEIECDYNTTYGGTSTITSNYIYINTKPATPKTSSFGVSYASDVSKKVDFKVAKPSNMTGTRLRVFKRTSNGYKAVKTYTFTGSYTPDYLKVYTNQVYRFAIQSYYTNPTNGKTYYSSWSKYNYFDLAKANYTQYYSSSGVKGTKVTVKKTPGVANYTVYVSKSRDSGYKKTATWKPTKSTQSYSLKKIGSSTMRKGTTYYVRIIPRIKVGSTLVNSQVRAQFSFTNYN